VMETILIVTLLVCLAESFALIYLVSKIRPRETLLPDAPLPVFPSFKEKIRPRTLDPIRRSDDILARLEREDETMLE
jgi:hypothetical protein